MRLFITCSLFCVFSMLNGQSFLQHADTIKPPSDYENIYTRPLYSDSLVSSFVIFIKKEVKPHKHVLHSEHVYVLEGQGEMTLGREKFWVKPGSMVFIPKNTVHALKVSTKYPVKVISVQAPFFDGTDRVAMPEGGE